MGYQENGLVFVLAVETLQESGGPQDYASHTLAIKIRVLRITSVDLPHSTIVCVAGQVELPEVSFPQRRLVADFFRNLEVFSHDLSGLRRPLEIRASNNEVVGRREGGMWGRL